MGVAQGENIASLLSIPQTSQNVIGESGAEGKSMKAGTKLTRCPDIKEMTSDEKSRKYSSKQCAITSIRLQPNRFLKRC